MRPRRGRGSARATGPARPGPDHRDRRHRSAGLPAAPRAAQTVLVVAGPVRARGLPRGARPVGAQRAVGGRRPQDDVVRGERGRPRGGHPTRLRRGTPGEHARRALRGNRRNVLVERDGELLTPPLDSGCLAGITRALLLEWAAEEGLPVREAAPRCPTRSWTRSPRAAPAWAWRAPSAPWCRSSSLDGTPLAVGPLTAGRAVELSCPPAGGHRPLTFVGTWRRRDMARPRRPRDRASA